MLHHLADSPQWIKIDQDYSKFGEEARNLQLALSPDGMNPHGIQSNSHITRLVILVIYNLPPLLCMNRKYMMLSMLISGPKQPRNDIDVYLAPLIKDLKQMWDTSVEVYAGYKENFTLRAMLFGTINDFSTYGIMSGYNIKGKCACPLCEESTYWMQLEHCTKNVFQGHRTFIPLTHCYRLLSKAFNGNIEECRALMPLIRYNLLENIQNLSNNFGKSCK